VIQTSISAGNVLRRSISSAAVSVFLVIGFTKSCPVVQTCLPCHSDLRAHS
jgi:hypothetical protein